ncbi:MULTISPECIES: tellurite resistance TerB family protein [unclassified Hyphomicrobium]|uniref:tellurite resistance TerB family protein n=1 Tax=unclassified Hyphomicrobium TaxID=2619925 RepID=UPI0002F2506B|nr:MULTISPECIES: tellurite resistance TerB family protein [unclassified Hyphomicrobium]
MFDAKSILENIVRGASPSGAGSSPQSGGGLGDILNDILKNAGGGAGGAPAGGNGSGGLGDILSQIGKSLSQGQSTSSGTGATAAPSGSNPELGDILTQLKDKLGQAGGAVTDGGSIGDILGKVFTQATQGVKEGSSRLGEATGANDALGRLASDPQAAEIISKLKGFIQNNPYTAGAAAGGLGGLLLGTQTGRSLAGSAARLGALAMIGGLAYKALQNYQAGRPLVTGATSTEPPPAGSGFEPAAVSNDAAVHYIQAMIAAAHADGRIDANEHDKIIGSLKQAGLDGEAEAFFARELNNPASVQDLADAVKNPQEALQLYTAARIAVADNSPAEQAFLSSLAAALRLDPKLAAHIDATAAAAA